MLVRFARYGVSVHWLNTRNGYPFGSSWLSRSARSSWPHCWHRCALRLTEVRRVSRGTGSTGNGVRPAHAAGNVTGDKDRDIGGAPARRRREMGDPREPGVGDVVQLDM